MLAVLIHRVFQQTTDLWQILKRFARIARVKVSQQFEWFDKKSFSCFIVISNPFYHLRIDCMIINYCFSSFWGGNAAKGTFVVRGSGHISGYCRHTSGIVRKIIPVIHHCRQRIKHFRPTGAICGNSRTGNEIGFKFHFRLRWCATFVRVMKQLLVDNIKPGKFPISWRIIE